MSAIPTISPDLRLAWLREHELFVRFLHGLAAWDPTEWKLRAVLWRGCLAEGLTAAEEAERILSASSEDAEGRA